MPNSSRQQRLRKLVQEVAGKPAPEDDQESLFESGLLDSFALPDLVSAIEKAQPSQSREAAIRTLVLLVAPMAPHLAEECWDFLGEQGMVVDASWPAFDPALLVDDEVTLAVQVNGKLRDTLAAARGLSREDAEALALASPKVQAQLAGASPRKVIVVPDRLVNIVA